MSLYEAWRETAENQRTQQEYNKFWASYFELEKEMYRKILSSSDTPITGKLSALAELANMDPSMFTGFIDGINTSLKNGEYDLESLTEDSDISLEVDFDKLYFNMLNAKADWLFGLSEWGGVRTEEERKAITKDFHASKIFKAEKHVGPNDPCPCGSGKKYKKCCGRNA